MQPLMAKFSQLQAELSAARRQIAEFHGERRPRHSVASFMIGNDSLFFSADKAALSFRSHHYTLDRFFKLRLTNGFLTTAGSQQCGFVYKIFEVCANETRSAASNGT